MIEWSWSCRSSEAATNSIKRSIIWFGEQPPASRHYLPHLRIILSSIFSESPDQLFACLSLDPAGQFLFFLLSCVQPTIVTTALLAATCLFVLSGHRLFLLDDVWRHKAHLVARYIFVKIERFVRTTEVLQIIWNIGTDPTDVSADDLHWNQFVGHFRRHYISNGIGIGKNGRRPFKVNKERSSAAGPLVVLFLKSK